MLKSIPCFISIISETNAPVLVYCPPKYKKDVEHVLKSNVLSNVSLDYFDSHLYEWSTHEKEVPIRPLFQVEGISVFGMLVKTTSLKIVIGFPMSESFDDDEIEEVFGIVRKLYVRVKCSPFVSLQSNDGNNELSKMLEDKLNEQFGNEEVAV